jgi:tmRNA-binding protein
MERFEAGIVLTGTEVKAAKDGKSSSRSLRRRAE